MKKIKEVIVFSAIVILSTFVNGLRAEDNVSPFSGYTLNGGISVKQLDFDYYRSEDSNLPAGSMTEGIYSTYFLRAGSPYVLSENRKWGYYFETGISNFSTSKQNVGDIEKNMGTSVEGNFWYVIPVGFFVFGPVPSGKKELSLLTGIGVGVGYLNAKGDMILTEDGSNESHKVDVSGFDIAASVLLEVYYGNWISRISGDGPYLDEGGSTYSIFKFSWDVGYTHTF